MEKKMYFKVDNGDTDQIVSDIDGCIEILKGECPDAVKDFGEEDKEEDAPYWTITPVWMTQQEFENLPDAY